MDMTIVDGKGGKGRTTAALHPPIFLYFIRLLSSSISLADASLSLSLSLHPLRVHTRTLYAYCHMRAQKGSTTKGDDDAMIRCWSRLLSQDDGH